MTSTFYLALSAQEHIRHPKSVARQKQTRIFPVGVFTGVLETDVSPDSKLTIHTVGGRLVPIEDLRAELTSDYDYLLIEWRDLPPGVVQLIGGFEPIFTSEEALLLRRRSSDA